MRGYALERIRCETERLTIRPVAMEDYPAFVSGYEACMEPVNRFDETYGDTGFMTIDWFRALIERRRREAAADYAYKFDVFRNSDGAIVGFCNIFPHYREAFQYARIGYAIHNVYWGKGYATECVKGLIEIGFGQLGLHRLEAHVNLDNPASKRVLEKAGFHFESIRKGFLYEDEKWTDNEIYYINSDMTTVHTA